MKLEQAKRMRLRDLLIIRVSETSETEDKIIEDFAAELSNTVRIPIVILKGDLTLESLSASQMRQAGWVRRQDGGG